MKPQAWSHTALNNFLTCPRQFYHLRVAKDVQDSKNEAALWGDRVHKAFEARLRDGTALPPELGIYEGYCAAIAKQAEGKTLLVEQQYAIDRNLQPCDWFSKEVWCRGIVDVLVVNGARAKVLDHKTGKRKPDFRQLKLFALLTFIHHPQVDTVDTAFSWIKERALDSEVFTRDQIPALWQEFLPDLQAYRTAFKTETWTPRESGLCRGWCPVKQCMFYKDKR